MGIGDQWMRLWKLTPVACENRAWRESETTAPVIVRAPNPTVARFQAACEFTRGTLPLTASPWWRTDLLRIEELDDPGLSRVGPTQVLGLTFGQGARRQSP